MTLTIVLARTPVRSKAAEVFGLDPCQGQPCFRGLLPEQTSWEEARALFQEHTIVSIDQPGIEIRLFEFLNGGTLGRIQVNIPADGSLSVGDVMLIYGSPCGVAVQPQAGKVILSYHGARFATPSNQATVNPYTPITTLEFMSGSSTTDAIPCAFARTAAYMDVINKIWRGFGPVWRYYP